MNPGNSNAGKRELSFLDCEDAQFILPRFLKCGQQIKILAGFSQKKNHFKQLG